MDLEVTSISPLVGARINVGADRLEEPAVVQRCLDLLDERAVLVFPRINLTNEQQLAFTDALGARLNFTQDVDGGDFEEKDIYTVTLDPEINKDPAVVHGTFFWHMDGLISNEVQPKASLLSARAVAAKGGQTEFANTFAAYAALTDDEKAELDGLTVEHSLYGILRQTVDPQQQSELARWDRRGIRRHPLVKAYRSGAKALTIGATADRIIELPVHEGRALLARLMDWAVQREFTYRHHWEVGDLVMWDNRGVLHRVISYDRHSGRRMHRTSVGGTVPEASAPHNTAAGLRS